MEHKLIKTANGEVHYWICRNDNPAAKCIVFTHGLTADHTMFEQQVAFFREKYTIITWDVPLHGMSRPYLNFTYQNAAEDLNAILEHEQIERAVLTGMSMGGYPSQMFAASYPDKVLGFVALDTTPFGTEYYKKFDLWCLKNTKPMFSWMSEKQMKKLIAKGNSHSQYGFDVISEMLKPLTKKELLEQIDIAYSGFIKENREMDFSFPIIILVGEYDRTGKVKDYCKEWAERKGYPLRYIKDAAHFSNADNYRQVNLEIENFICSL